MRNSEKVGSERNCHSIVRCYAVAVFLFTEDSLFDAGM